MEINVGYGKLHTLDLSTSGVKPFINNFILLYNSFIEQCRKTYNYLKIIIKILLNQICYTKSICCNFLLISWRSVWLVEETGVHRENLQPSASHLQISLFVNKQYKTLLKFFFIRNRQRELFVFLYIYIATVKLNVYYL